MEVEILDVPSPKDMAEAEYHKRYQLSVTKDLWRDAVNYGSESTSVRNPRSPPRTDVFRWSPYSRSFPPRSIRWGEHQPGSSVDNPIAITDEKDETVDSLARRFTITCNTGVKSKDYTHGELAMSLVRSALEIEEIEAVPAYKPGASLLLHDGSYLRVEKVCKSFEGHYYQGRRLFSMTDSRVKPFIPKFPGELLWVSHETQPISQRQVRRSARFQFTNLRATSQNPAQMLCRVKLTIKTKDFIPDDTREPLNTKQEYSVEYLSFDEADSGLRLSSSKLRSEWRGPTVPFGEAELPPIIPRRELGDTETSPIDLDTQTRAYTFGDGFCGAGGVSCGAKKAGFSIRWAFDSSAPATKTYQYNFPGTIIENAEVYHFLTNDDNFLRVDVFHGSPPCQPFSPAHTVNCERDEANSACIFSCEDLVKRAKPRILTMEETHGLVERHEPTFDCVIRGLVGSGYSVRWAVLDCVDYGVPQSRKRLVIIAAGPGETLPQFPSPTHGLPGSGLQRFATIHSAIHDIPDDAMDHDPTAAEARYRLLGYRKSYSAHTPAKTITCGGGEHNFHPNGRRKFTTREFASLQTFPLDFQFSGRETRRQIGNAVPPLFAAAIYREIYRSLCETDQKELQA